MKRLDKFSLKSNEVTFHRDLLVLDYNATEADGWVSLADYNKLDQALSQILDALEDRYDGAPDAGMGWMAELIQIAKRARG
jgi:regulator of sigma D